MQIYLQRHGIAEDGRPASSDAERALTQDGRRKLRQVLAAAADAGVKPTLIVSSPLKRALQTAELAKQVLGYKADILQTKALAPNSTPEQAWEEIRSHRDEQSIFLVGHNPLFDSLSAYLLGSSDMNIGFKKGAILRVDVESFPVRPKGRLRWYLTPKLAAASKT
jgi:phosphohistidine phosphatase